MRRTLKAEVTVTFEVPDRMVQRFDNDDLADTIRGAVGNALQERFIGSPIQVVAWTVWRSDDQPR